MTTICVDTWLYGPLARFAGDPNQMVFANPQVELPEGSTMRDLLTQLGLPTEERGITFINGELSAMPGLQPDLSRELQSKDRVALFHLKAMYPFQYRQGLPMAEEFSEAMQSSKDGGLHHTYTEDKPEA
jgi:hypothetical protein